MSSNTIRYFCYGSNLLSDRIHIRLKNAQFLSKGTLDDFKLTFSGHSNYWRGATANIIPYPGDQVIGIIWSITYKDLEQLSLQEIGYRLIAIEVNLEDGQRVECITYVQTKETISRGKEILGSEDGIPSIIYKEVIRKGAVEHKLPESYIKMIESFKANTNTDCELVHLAS